MVKRVLIAIAVLMTAAISQAANWKQVGNDTRIAVGAGSRVIEVDLDSIKRSATEISLIERETQSSVGTVGYSCREGDVRHGITSKDIAAIFYRTDLPDHYPGAYAPVWVTFETKTVNGESWYTQYDSAALYVIHHEMAPAVQRRVTIKTMQVCYDCRGYYRLSAGWIQLDTTDKIGGVPRGYVSPERQVSNWVCAK